MIKPKSMVKKPVVGPRVVSRGSFVGASYQKPRLCCNAAPGVPDRFQTKVALGGRAPGVQGFTPSHLHVMSPTRSD